MMLFLWAAAPVVATPWTAAEWESLLKTVIGALGLAVAGVVIAIFQNRTLAKQNETIIAQNTAHELNAQARAAGRGV